MRPGEPRPGATRYGAPVRLWRALERRRPPGFGRVRAWRSPLRGPWLTSVFAVVLLAGLPIVTVTGLLSYAAYSPRFGQAFPPDAGWLRLPYFEWPTRPAWLYRVTQGLHVVLGLALVPVVLGKLWSVAPKLFAWPPARSFAQLLERVTLLLLVGGILFEIVTGVLNIQYAYVFGFGFYEGHYYGAWVFIGAFAAHVTIKLPRMVRALRSRPFRDALRDDRPEPPDPDGLVPAAPRPATMTRRGALAFVGGGSLLVAVMTAGQVIGGAARRTAFLAPRGGHVPGPGEFPVNRTAAAAGITAEDVGARWRLVLRGGGRTLELDRADLLALPQHTAELPIACVEGWATVRTWSGVRLRDLAAAAGVPEPASAYVRSAERYGAFNQATLQANQVADPDSLLALRVDGADLPLDHGRPARVIVPALPGVHNTKWVRLIEFRTR
ncbi:hypothetical protein BJF79_09185 [Actinomadura sp. CNU-125]|uniref:molybdopterin-dependent oxidoreductase n=1 Tax=Actinomadura sp. CNU-125 TaxID=1904961 RepID=UPI000958FE38|nr:molybdopterin-dependent oxidoreductase [Actinomadura sp. CNU-125]OLT31160.1 hypothetical protein BJF79_09185 [Actinomadura sp. CNU-125]